MHAGKVLPPNERQTLLKHRFRLPGKADDDVRRNGNPRHLGTDLAQETIIARRVVGAAHVPQNRIVASLKRQVEVTGEAPLIAQKRKKRRREFHGFQRSKPQAL